MLQQTVVPLHVTNLLPQNSPLRPTVMAYLKISLVINIINFTQAVLLWEICDIRPYDSLSVAARCKFTYEFTYDNVIVP